MTLRSFANTQLRFLTLLVVCNLLTLCGSWSQRSMMSDLPSPALLAAWQARFPELDPLARPPGGLPAPAPVIQLPQGVRVLLLLGADGPEPGQDPASWEEPLRTDSLILVFYHPQRRISLVSLPRDAYVYLPGFGMATLKWAYSLGGWQQLSATIDYNLGVHSQDWVLVDFNNFIRFVDELDGLPLEITQPLADCGGLSAGLAQLDGATTLCYIRSRFSTSDFDRRRRQQQVAIALVERSLSQDVLANLPEWYGRYRNSLRSSLSLFDLLMLAPSSGRFAQIDRFSQSELGPEQGVFWRVPQTGAEVYLLDALAAQEVLQRAADFAATP